METRPPTTGSADQDPAAVMAAFAASQLWGMCGGKEKEAEMGLQKEEKWIEKNLLERLTGKAFYWKD